MLAEARAEADAIISRTRADAARAGEELKQKARADAENIVRNAEREIELRDVARACRRSVRKRSTSRSPSRRRSSSATCRRKTTSG